MSESEELLAAEVTWGISPRELRECRETTGEFGTLLTIAQDLDNRAKWIHSLELHVKAVLPLRQSTYDD